MKSHALRRFPLAFTLIELLVVISIVAILSAIALPISRNLLEDGKATKDLSNLRQIGMAASLHSSEHGFLMGEAWPSTLSPTYLRDWKVLQSDFDRRPAPAHASEFPISYDLNGKIWGVKPELIVSRPDCILFAPLMSDPDRLQFASTRGQPSLPRPLGIGSNGAGAKGGTHRNGKLITVLFADGRAAPMSMSTFHSKLPNPDTESEIPDLRWNH
jgi:prepilin-type N-terminal cleavage/methylation domain-containing protein